MMSWIRTIRPWALSLAVVCSSAATTTPTLAANDQVPPGFDHDACLARSRTSSDVNDCNHFAWLQEDAALNVVYKRLSSRLPVPERSRLRTVQRAWIKARDAQCKMIWADSGLDSNSRTNSIYCYFEETAKRRLRLEGLEARLDGG